MPVARDRPYACCVVVWRDIGAEHEFLVLHRLAPGGVDFDGDWAWTPPSGARQPGETPEVAAARELREETGLALALEAVSGASGSDDVALYAAQASTDTEVMLDHEHDRYLWLRLDDAVTRCAPVEVAQGLRKVAEWLMSQGQSL